MLNQQQLLNIFKSGIPLMDTRAPVEFTQGAFPNAHNLPLMTDEERAKVGTCYKHSGQEAAIKLGHKLVSGKIKQQRIEQWRAFIDAHPDGFLYCFRGGLRSHTVKQWLADEGINYPLITGGYKALRRFMIETLEQQSATRKFIIISGRTGTGKTIILNQLPGNLDLEARANHRGSSFGRHPSPQPTQINFEHQITTDLIQNERPVVFVEDESQVIGSLHIPDCLMEALRKAAIIVVEKTMQERVAQVYQDYVIGLGQEYQLTGRADAHEAHTQYMLKGLDRVRKRLGGLLHQQVRQIMEQAFQNKTEPGIHFQWIELLLSQYYDRMYDYQLENKKELILGRTRGDQEEILRLAAL